MKVANYTAPGVLVTCAVYLLCCLTLQLYALKTEIFCDASIPSCWSLIYQYQTQESLFYWWDCYLENQMIDYGSVISISEHIKTFHLIGSLFKWLLCADISPVLLLSNKILITCHVIHFEIRVIDFCSEKETYIFPNQYAWIMGIRLLKLSSVHQYRIITA